MRPARRSLPYVATAALIAAGLPLVTTSTSTANPQGTGLVISQVYGGGGNSGAPYTHDFIEIFNPTDAPVSLAGWSVQYASATGTGNLGANSGQLTELPDATLAPGQFLLIHEASGGAAGAPLPTPDVTDPTPINMSASAGKVALVTSAAGLGCNGGSTPCTPEQLAQIVDLVGYGNANFFEGVAPAPTLTNTTAAFRAGLGCTDTDTNLADFFAVAPAPRNTAAPFNPCLSGDLPPSVSMTNPVNGDIDVAIDASISVTFSEAVNAAVSAFTISCSSSATARGSRSGGPTTFTLDPVTDFASGESCTLTVSGGGGHRSGQSRPAGHDGGRPRGHLHHFRRRTTVRPTLHVDPSIQGSGPSAAITGTVTTQGVVVGDFDGPLSGGLQGFYLQDPAGDGNAATSDGIFVFTGDNAPVTAGQLVRVTGFARERFNQTALNGSNSNTSAVTDIVACGESVAVTPTDVTLPVTSTNDFERFEGMLVRLPQSLVISEYFNYDRFGELVLALPQDGEDRPFTPTPVVEPGAPAQALAASNALRRITLDDGRGSQNPEFLRHPNGDAFALDNRFRGGDTVQDVVGVVGFDFDLYRIQPTGPATYTEVNPRPENPETVGGDLRVAAMNTLNYFITPDYPTGDSRDNACGPVPQRVECRGADFDQPAELTRQRDKLLAALSGLDADIIGLNEIENTTGVDPLNDPVSGIVPGLNAMPGVGPYAGIDTGVIGTDAIRVGLIYRPDKVVPVGAFQVLTTAVDPRFIDTRSRPVLAQTFEEIATGARFTVAVNHLKSKGSACIDIGDPDTGDGQGNCNLTRKAAAEALVDWLATDPTGSGDRDFLIVGDLNSYAMEDPIDAIRAGADDTPGTADDYTNLVAEHLGEHAYSFVFDGQAGYLDHALSGASLTPQVTGVAEWHINADEPDVVDYDTSFKGPTQEALYEANSFRASDHDPILAGLDLDVTYDDLCRLTKRLVTKTAVELALCATLAIAEEADRADRAVLRDAALKAYRFLAIRAGGQVGDSGRRGAPRGSVAGAGDLRGRLGGGLGSG